MTLPAIEIERSQSLLVVVRFQRAATEQEFAERCRAPIPWWGPKRKG